MLGKTAFFAFGVALILGAGILATDSVAQGNVKSKTQGTSPTLGTAQLPGDNGKVGTKYQLGAKGAELHFTLDSATVDTRYKTVSTNLIAEKDERLLILSFTVQNPTKIEQSADSRSFKFTVVSPDDKNVEASGPVYEPVKRTPINQMLKPAQKVKLAVVIPIFAQGPITKLIVARGTGAVLRFDLREAMVKSTSVFAGEDGVSINNEAKSELNKAIDFDGFDIEIQEVGEAKDAIGVYQPSSSSGLYFATVKFSNPMMKPLRIGWQYFTPTLTDENGETVHWPSDMVSMASGSTVSQDVDPDGSIRARYIFSGAKGLKLAKFKLTRNSTGRSVTVKLP